MSVFDYRAVAREILTVHSDDGRELSCSCPFHSDRRPSFRFNALNGLWMCHSCQESGNAFSLYKNLTGEELVVDDVVEYRSMLEKLNEKVEPKYGSLAEACDHASMYQCGDYSRYWFDRGIVDDNVIQKFGLGFDRFENALTIPTEYGIVRRFIEYDDVKYRFPKGMLKASMLYGYDFVDNPVVAVCEGQIDALACWQAGVNAVAIFGSSISKAQVELLKSLDVQFLVLFLDDDEQGWEGNDKIRDKVGGSLAVAEVDYSGYEGLDPGSLPMSAINNLVSNALGSM